MKTALVTGSSKGLGRAIAVALAEKGYYLFVQYRNSKKDAEETLQLVKQYSDGELVQADLLHTHSLQALFAAIKSKGRFDILVNLVGDFHFKSMEDTSSEDIEAVLRSNISTMYACCKEALPIMRAQGFGKILNFGAAGCDSLVLREKTTPYYIAKTGVLMLTKVLAAEEKKKSTGITINCISPGILETSVAKPDGAPIVPLQEMVDAILALIASDHNGENVTISRGWKPENQH